MDVVPFVSIEQYSTLISEVLTNLTISLQSNEAGTVRHF